MRMISDRCRLMPVEMRLIEVDWGLVQGENMSFKRESLAWACMGLSIHGVKGTKREREHFTVRETEHL